MAEKIIYGDLFAHVALRVAMHEKDGKLYSNCKNDLRFTEEFCEQHGLDFKAVKERLESEGGYCDCEVLFNAEENINPKENMPKEKTQ